VVAAATSAAPENAEIAGSCERGVRAARWICEPTGVIDSRYWARRMLARVPFTECKVRRRLVPVGWFAAG
jgi:hypothetical protein